MVASTFKSSVLMVVSLVVPLSLAAQSVGVQVKGQEIEAWFASDQMAVAGIGLVRNCHWITKGAQTRRYQTIYCPGEAPFTVVGEARVEGDKICSKFVYPDGSKNEACQEIFRVGENKYEIRVDGVTRNVMYRILR